MRILQKLMPWYRWDDRWSPTLIHCPCGPTATPCHFIIPDDYYVRLVSVHYDMHLVAGIRSTGTYVDIYRGSFFLARLWVMLVLPGDRSYHIQWTATDDARSGLAGGLTYSTYPMQTTLYLVPQDRLEIVISGALAGDLLDNVYLDAQTWRA